MKELYTWLNKCSKRSEEKPDTATKPIYAVYPEIIVNPTPEELAELFI